MKEKYSIRRLVIGLAVATAVLSSSIVHAAWPEKPITLVAPFPAGGNADALARQVGAALANSLGQPVIVENRPGAGGMLGSQYVARARPDGHTFLLGSFANILNEFFYSNKLIDLRRDLAPVTQLVNIPNYVAVGSNSKYKSMKDLLDDIRTRPGQVTCGTSGAGTSSHLVCEMLSRQLGLKISMVPYRGGIPAIIDVIGGQTSFVAINEALPYIKDKRVRGLAVTSPQKSPLAPDLPPLSDSVPGFAMVSWYGIFAPVGTPKEVVQKMGAAVATAVRSPAMRDALNVLGATPVGNSPAEFSMFVSSELKNWEKIIKPMNIQLD
ncbi:Bug family tripartite tricarboxylate transporter substrate binding protein [Cupriavidus consociatus]|uniref:Bug family tripartite tricarboxylate transporter substrate binding protein n=1 Tax=Cupriavidus consociatus TaxID=2821357 RepID=UPI001AE8D61C|nr:MULTISPECIES: tripartite tricarboxylate transporter substrate binding protein [unclassified Cupriavidus]MBP0623362.1 tripartite tricarboxylate transporter substrate binding protein [Cupriavidus sp. LEh25]MDK2660059.1 tripartite tricarboxylate transporter substrate binding protein [Cupriavidus sp. LEh21]